MSIKSSRTKRKNYFKFVALFNVEIKLQTHFGCNSLSYVVIHKLAELCDPIAVGFVRVIEVVPYHGCGYQTRTGIRFINCLSLYQ